FFSSRRRHTRLQGDWSSDVCSSDLDVKPRVVVAADRDNSTLLDKGAGPALSDVHLTADRERATADGVQAVRVGDRADMETVVGRSEERRVGKDWSTRGLAGGGLTKN